MNLPQLIKQVYGEFSFTGLYSFEFVDAHRNTITEIFFMMPPKSKHVQEGTRTTINPTFGGNFVTDAGNSIKTISLSGECWIPHVGSTDNPLQGSMGSDVSTNNLITGGAEFLKIRFMLSRYRDYTMTRNAQVDVPAAALNASPEIAILYEKVSNLVNKKIGALYDQVRVIFHDYDMEDHFYCRVSSFSYSQSDDKYLVIDYTAELECYEVDNRQSTLSGKVTKKSLESEMDIMNDLTQKA